VYFSATTRLNGIITADYNVTI